MKRINPAQSLSEYLVMMSVILAAALAIGFFGRMRGSFETYFNAAKNTIVPQAQ